MRYRVTQRALLVLLAVLALIVAVPAAASASIMPALTLSPSSVSAGATQALAFNLSFSHSSGDYATSLSLTLPPGLLLDLGLNGGACLNSATSATGCELGTVTATPAPVLPLSLWLVKGPSASDVAGAVIENSLGTPTGTADITLRTTPTVGLNVSFPTGSLPASLTALDLNLASVRAPTSCPATPATVGVSATSSEVSTPQTSSTSLPVSGCGSLAYAPQVATTVDQDDNGAGATFDSTITEAATAAATQALEIDPPSSLSPNVSNALKCLLGTPCTIGTASAVSPFLPPSALSSGTIQLGGSITSPSLSIAFPAPYAVSLTGAINISTEAITFTGIPDLPLTSLVLDVGGGSSTQLFTTNCAASTLTTKLTPWNGAAPVTSSAPITFGGTCPATPTGPTGPTPPASQGKPTVKGASLRGLVKRTARIAFTVTEGKGAKPIKRIALSLPKGLSLSNKKASLTKGIVVKGAHAKKLKFTTSVKHGVLTITLSSAATQASVTLESPELGVSSKLAKSVKSQLHRKKVAALSFAIKVTDSANKATKLALKLKPKS